MNKQAHAVKTSWARAHRLAELAVVTPSIARNYLTTTQLDITLLDGEVDKRNSTIREMVTATQTHSLPVIKKTKTKTKKAETNGEGRKRAPRRNASITLRGIPFETTLLTDIQHLADKHGGLRKITTLFPHLQKLTKKYGSLDALAAGCDALNQLRDYISNLRK